MNVQSNEAAQKTINEDFPLALPKGSVLAGQYTIDDVLGQGGFGITYVATDYKTGQKVAVKEFFPDSLAYREMTTVISYPGERAENYEYGKENFLGEAKTLAEFIGCENIVRIYSYFEENGTAYFVMEYIEGVSFDHYLKERGGKISCDEAKSILVPVMEALAIVHSKGIVHRDVTPDNIYITNDGTVKLLDFGAARYSLGDKSKSLDVILKHGFAPKEQYTRRGKQGPFTDIYSLGATFYFAITGRRPPDSIDRIEEDELIPPSSLGVKITSYQEEAILHALEVSPQSRYQSMLDFRNVLLNETAPAPASMAVNQHFFNAPPTPAAMPAQQIPYTAQQPYNMPQQQAYPMNSQPYPAPAQQTENVSKQLGEAAKQFGSAAVQLGGGVAKQLGNTAKQLGGSAAKHMSNAAKQLSEAAAKANDKVKSAAAHNESKAIQNGEAVSQSVPEVQHDEPLQSNSEFTNPAPKQQTGNVSKQVGDAENQPADSVPKKKMVNSKLLAVLAAVVLIAGLSMVLNKDDKNNSVASSKNNYKNTYTTTTKSKTSATTTSKSSKTEETTAKSKSNVSITDANENAKHCHTACTTAIAQMYADGKNVPSGAFEGSGTDFTIGGVKFDEILRWLGDNFTGYTYGYVKENWGIEYVLWSDIPIPDEYKHELTETEQKELAQNGTVIGSYPTPLKEEGGGLKEDEELDWTDALGKSPEEAVKILEKVCGVSLPYYTEDLSDYDSCTTYYNTYYTSKTNSAIPIADGIDMYFNSIVLDYTSDNVVYNVSFYYSGFSGEDASTSHTGDECILLFNVLYETFCEAFGEPYETNDYGGYTDYTWYIDDVYHLYLCGGENLWGMEGNNDVIYAWIDSALDPRN